MDYSRGFERAFTQRPGFYFTVSEMDIQTERFRPRQLSAANRPLQGKTEVIERQ